MGSAGELRGFRPAPWPARLSESQKAGVGGNVSGSMLSGTVGNVKEQSSAARRKTRTRAVLPENPRSLQVAASRPNVSWITES